MRRWVALLFVMTASGFTASALSVGPVAALSCAPDPDSSPEAVASGTDHPTSEHRFLDRFDFAVVGTVTEIHTVAQGQPDYGKTTVHLDVSAVLGDEPAPQTITITSSDPGWYAGYAYRTGETYFIPVQSAGPRGEPNYSFVCDPITAVDPATVAELGRLAADAGIPWSTPEREVMPDPAPDVQVSAATVAAAVDDSIPSGARSEATSAVQIVLTVAIVAAAVVTMMVAVRRRDQHRVGI